MKDGLIVNLIVGSSVDCPLTSPLFPYLKVVDCRLSYPLSCPLYRYMEVVGSLICMEKFPWAVHGWPTELPLFQYITVVGSLIFMAKFTWTANWQPTPLPTVLPTFFIFGSSWLPNELPTELPTVSKYGSSGQPNLHVKLPTGSPWAAHAVTNMQPMDSEVGSSHNFPVWARCTVCLE